MRARLWLSGQLGWTLPQNTYSYSKNLLASLAATPQHWLHSGLFLDNHSIHKLDRFKLKSNIYVSSCVHSAQIVNVFISVNSCLLRLVMNPESQESKVRIQDVLLPQRESFCSSNAHG